MAYPAVLRETRTKDDGSFRLEDLPGPTAAINQRRTDVAWPEEDREIQVDREVELVFRGFGVIQGRVVEEPGGAPVTVFTVKLWGGTMSPRRFNPGESFTSADGRFTLEDLEAETAFGLIVEAEGYVPARVEGVTPGAGERRIALARGRALEGIAVDAESGAPLAGVRAGWIDREGRPEELLGVDWDAVREGLTVRGLRVETTAADGSFRFLEDRPGALLFRAPGRKRLLVLPEERSRHLLTDGRLQIPLEPAETVSGTCWEGGRPASGAQVTLHLLGDGAPGAADGEQGMKAHGDVSTDGEGKFRWEDVPAGACAVEVERAGRERELRGRIRRRIEVKRGEEARVDLGKDLGMIRLDGSLSGMEAVRYGEHPLEGARLVPGRRSSGTTSSSAFSSTGPRDGGSPARGSGRGSTARSSASRPRKASAPWPCPPSTWRAMRRSC